MRRAILLTVLIGVGGLSLGVTAQLPQGPPSQKALQATKIEKVKDNLYIITGSSAAADFSAFSGGNTAVFVTDAGVVLVDTKLPLWGPALLERIKTVTNKPVTTIINTHTHGDHTGSNEFFGAMVESVVHANTKVNMEKMDAFKGDNAKFLPKKSFNDKLSVGVGKDRIDLYYFGPGHTNGDTWVVFPSLRVAHAGDMFTGKEQPLVDPMNGGSIVAFPDTLAKAAATMTDVDTVIPGHSALMTRKDLQEYADFNKDFVSWVRTEIAAGKSVDAAAAGYKIAEKYKGYAVNPIFGGIKPTVQQAYDELKK